VCISGSGTRGALTKTPQNVVVLRGQDAILNCSTDSKSTTGHNPITWNYDNDMISYSPCTSQNPGFVASPSNSATDCNIRALGSWEHGISGAYRCIDQPFRQQGLAMVIVLGERQFEFLSCFTTSAKEVMFLPVFVCLSSRVSHYICLIT